MSCFCCSVQKKKYITIHIQTIACKIGLLFCSILCVCFLLCSQYLLMRYLFIYGIKQIHAELINTYLNNQHHSRINLEEKKKIRIFGVTFKIGWFLFYINFLFIYVWCFYIECGYFMYSVNMDEYACIYKSQFE